ncbi:MAG: MBL fold metallo-hydrolase [Phycisphaerales bacterium]|nr:MBL fold metallo-hydrolase [Phycisphaerales bacterium]
MDAVIGQIGPDETAAAPAARLCVLGSGSRANCAALHTRSADGRDAVCLFDLGYSPRMTQRLLERVGLSLEMVTAVLLTHLDADHCHPGWNCGEGRGGDGRGGARGGGGNVLPPSASLFLHEGHLQRAYARGLNGGRLSPFSGGKKGACQSFTACSAAELIVRPLMMSHDDLGAAVFRVQVGEGAHAPALGYATDLGRVTGALIDHFADGNDGHGVDALVIESNYCPKLQLASDRPEFLKRRVMGGSGHLSNNEALEAIEAIAPREHVVLVHLSQQCNDPSLVAALHEGCDYTLTISSQDEPTRWVPVRRGERAKVVMKGRGGQLPLWA